MERTPSSKRDSAEEQLEYKAYSDSWDAPDRSSMEKSGADENDMLLNDLGYKQELNREFGMMSAFSFAVSISGVFATIGTTFYYPLVSGGSSSAVWCWAIGGASCMTIALSVAELVSSYPTSGGLYYTCSRVFPPKIAPFMCWIDGWLNLLGQISGVASTDYGAAQMLLSAVSMGTDFKYVPTANHAVGVMAAILVLHGLISSLPTKYIERITKFYVVFHYSVLVAGAVALLAKTSPKHDATYVFTNVEANTGWSPVGWSWLLGLLSPSWVMTDYDATSHLCEELADPARIAPWAIAMALGSTYVLGFMYMIVLCFCMGDPSLIMQQSQPVAMIYYNSLGKSGGIAFTVFMFVVANFVGITALQAASRTVWAQARDEMFPWASKYLYRVTTLTKTPTIAVVVSTVLCIAINLIALGSTETINAIFNVCAIALDVSYCIPIAGKILFPKLNRKGPWNLGRFSFAVNSWACMWTAFVTIVFFMPTEMPVTAQNMNYAVVFFVSVIVASILCWYAGGSKYKGPAAHVPDPEAIAEKELHSAFTHDKSE